MGSNHKALTANIFYNWKIPACNFSADIVTCMIYSIEEVWIAYCIKNYKTCCTGKWISCKGGLMVSCHKNICCLTTEEAGSHWNASCNSFGKSYNFRLKAKPV